MITVIYHSADFDGLFCREIAIKKFGADALYIGWDYGDPVPVIPPGTPLYMLDVCIEALMGTPELVWIDHHKTAIEKYDLPVIGPAGYRIDGVAACRLAYQYFFGIHKKRMAFIDGTSDEYYDRLPGLEDYKNRYVVEPVAVRLAGEYDVGDKRDNCADQFQFGLQSVDLEYSSLIDPYVTWWQALLGFSMYASRCTYELIMIGKTIQYYQDKQNESIIKAQGFTLEFEGKKFLAINTARYNSSLFTDGLRPEHDGCLGFNWDGEKWRVSMFTVPGKPDEDFSTLAVKYGGGGHKGACGFTASTLPWITN